MATTTAPTTAPAAARSHRPRRLGLTGIGAGVAAGLANVALVAVARAADVQVGVDGESIPLAGFLQLTVIGAVFGALIATVGAARSARPRRTFLTITGVLTALSIVPDLLVDTDTGSRLVLIATHLVAAAVIVPALARRLPE
jgi:peptidoglycan/LPS O-acetylase OafA/YrhL